jgi:hypothetical protein
MLIKADVDHQGVAFPGRLGLGGVAHHLDGSFFSVGRELHGDGGIALGAADSRLRHCERRIGMVHLARH